MTAPKQHDDFETMVVSELQTLREGEKRLSNLYGQLPAKPHLKESFLWQLAEVHLRTERLHAVLNPIDTLEFPEMAYLAPKRRPAA
jgi:hypothetical protein